MGVKKRIQLKVSPETVSPAVCGLLKPFILVPAELADKLSTAQLRSVLFHEVAHVKRRDLWVNCAQTLLQILYWWHPLLWLANARIRRVREEAVDETVMVALGREAESYPSALLEVAKSIIPKTSFGLGLLGIVESRGAFAQRIQRLLTRPIPDSAGLNARNLAVWLLIAITVLPMAKAEGKKSDQPASVIAENVPPHAPVVSSLAGQKNKKLMTVEVKFYALPPAEISKINLGRLSRKDEQGVSSWTLESKELKTFYREIAQQRGATLLSAPRITTSEGRQAVLQVMEDPESRDVFSVGVMPSSEGEVIHLNLKVHAGQLSGMDKRAELLRFFKTEADTLKSKVEEADRNPQNYNENTTATFPRDRRNIDLQALAQAQADLFQAEADAEIAQKNAAELDRVEDVRTKQKKLFEISGDITLKTLIATLNKREADLSSLLTRYTEKWPAVKEAHADIGSLQNSIEEQTARIVAALKAKAELTRATAESLKNQVGKREQQLMKLNNQWIEYDILSRDLQSKRELLNKMLERMQELEITMRNKSALENPKIGEASFVSTDFYVQTDVALQNGGGAIFQIPDAATRDGKIYLLVATATIHRGSSESILADGSAKR